MLPILLTLLFCFARAEDNNPASFTVQEVYLHSDDYGVGLTVSTQGRLHLRPLLGSKPLQADRLLLAKLGEHDLSRLQFRDVLTLENRAFGVLADGRVVEIVLVFDRHLTLARHWIHRLTSAGIGAGGSLVAAGLATGHGGMSVVGGLIGLASGVLPFVSPTLGIEVYLDYSVVALGGDHPFQARDLVQSGGQAVDLMMVRGDDEISLASYLRKNPECGRYLAAGTFERQIQ